MTVRVVYEHATRIGSGFSEASIEDGGAQPGLRFYDEADRDRNKGTLLFVAHSGRTWSTSRSRSPAAKDTYNGPGHDFGLLNNTNTSYNVGVNLTPTKQVGFGANYGYEKYNSLQKSRNANPPAAPTTAAGPIPNRDWNLNNDENVNNFDAVSRREARRSSTPTSGSATTTATRTTRFSPRRTPHHGAVRTTSR